MRKNILSGFLLLFCLVVAACERGDPPQVATVGGALHVDWKGADIKGPLTIRTLRATAEASYHMIRLDGSEKLHVHEGRDATVFVLEGHGRMRLGEQDIEIKAGDVIEIPRGVPHQAESLQKPIVVYAIFTPPNDSTDYREIIL